ncbi:hypothetical protein HPB51_001531 [Rhipicephalus microplus]|uniref:Uncharacterized protein n=1 Tax=Rhipicephalus microplus TaxID=6941 RepID=A0A9J6EVY1_RHIMP|nr:hypothetical protein HPB51_001531 [Rhipicephalus microplus]
MASCAETLDLAFLLSWWNKSANKWLKSGPTWQNLVSGKSLKLPSIDGGSNGLGRTLCLELARRGARVVIACRTRLRRDSTAFFLREKTGSFNFRVMYMDLTNLESIREFAKELIASEQRLDCIVNNAGNNGRTRHCYVVLPHFWQDE